MFSKKGFESYFGQLLEIELDMARALEETMAAVQDKQVLKQLGLILADERRHATMVAHMKKLFEA